MGVGLGSGWREGLTRSGVGAYTISWITGTDTDEYNYTGLNREDPFSGKKCMAKVTDSICERCIATPSRRGFLLGIGYYRRHNNEHY